MAEKNIILAYNEKKTKIKVPNNFEELKDTFFSIFK